MGKRGDVCPGKKNTSEEWGVYNLNFKGFKKKPLTLVSSTATPTLNTSSISNLRINDSEMVYTDFLNPGGGNNLYVPLPFESHSLLKLLLCRIVFWLSSSTSRRDLVQRFKFSNRGFFQIDGLVMDSWIAQWRMTGWSYG